MFERTEREWQVMVTYRRGSRRVGLGDNFWVVIFWVFCCWFVELNAFSEDSSNLE